MSTCPFSKESLDQLRLFLDILQKKPEYIHVSELDFFRDFIKSFGGVIPEKPAPEMKTESPIKEEAAPEETVESDTDESVLEFDTDGCVEPDTVDDSQAMGDTTVTEVSEEDQDKAFEKLREAIQQVNEGNLEEALKLFNEAITINPLSALLLAKRGQVYLKLSKPNACIRDCKRALELNCDSAAAYKFRGRAYRLLGDWEKAAQDLRQACKIDFDEQADEWLKEVNPNALKIEQHKLKYERKRLEKKEKEQRERLQRAREAHAKAAQGEGPTDMPSFGGQMPNFGGQMPSGLGDFYKLLQDPDIMTAFQDPEVAAAFQDVSSNPANFAKYQSNPKIKAVLEKLSTKLQGGGGMGFPGFGGGFPDFGGGAPSGTGPDDDGLD